MLIFITYVLLTVSLYFQKYAGVIRDAVEKWVKSAENAYTPTHTDIGEMEATTTDENYQIAQLAAQTGMNAEFSRQCLDECGWNLDLAFEAFRRVQAAGVLPASALS